MIKLTVPYRVLHLNRTGSTNDDARLYAGHGAAHGLVVVADRQDKGRGRRGRAWDSSTGDLLFSLVLRPSKPPAEIAQIGFVAANAVAAALENLGLVPQCKWPNDVLVGGHKLCGILPEAAAIATGDVPWVILGVGLNIVSQPPETSYPATSLKALGIVARPEKILQDIVTQFDRRYCLWIERGFDDIRTEWITRAIGLRAPVSVRLAHDHLQGIFADLDAKGGLVLELPGGARRLITAGEVYFS